MQAGFINQKIGRLNAVNLQAEKNPLSESPVAIENIYGVF